MATLTLHFTPPTPAPAGGYLMRYRKVGQTSYTSLAITGSPAVISNVQAGVVYEGDLTAVCSGTSSSSPITWSTPPVTPCVTMTREILPPGSAPDVTCLGTQYAQEVTRITGTLAVAVSYNIDIVCETLISSTCQLPDGPGTVYITILAGQLSGHVDFVSTTRVDCGQAYCDIRYVTDQENYSIGTGNAVICPPIPQMITNPQALYSQRYATLADACAEQDSSGASDPAVYSTNFWHISVASGGVDLYYTDQAAQNVVPNGFYRCQNAGSVYQGAFEVTNDVISVLQYCPGGGPGVLAGIKFGQAYQTPAAACATTYASNTRDIYTLNNSFAVGETLYLDAALTQPISAGYYRGTDLIYMGNPSGQLYEVDSTGTIINNTVC